jgi:prepilin signal peptidase PulO-like enzyme (type II secretory pathway)
VLALVGVLATAFHKSSRAIPFGPWLALGAFVAIWLQGWLMTFFGPAGRWLWSIISGDNSWVM